MMPDVFGTEASPDNLTDEEKLARFFAGASARPLPPTPKEINQPGDVTPGIGRARAEVATPPPAMPSVPPAPDVRLGSASPTVIAPPRPKTPAETLREQGAPKLGGWKQGLSIAANALVPGLTRMIPGTVENYQQLLGQAEKEESHQLGLRKEQANIADIEAQTAERNRMPAAKPDKEEKWTVIPGALGPNGEPVEVEANSGQMRVATTPGVTMKEPPSPKDNKAVAGTVDGKPAWGLQTDTGWVDPENKRPLPGFKPPLNYAQGVAPTKTVEILGADNVMHRFQFNENTGKYDIDMGAAPTGTAAHQIFQAGAIEKLAPQVIADIQANRAILGKLSSYYKQWLAGTPVSDPAAAALLAELMSFAAMQPALHAFRSTNALEAFEKMIGGLAKDPDATIATIQALLKTPQAFTGMANSNKTATPPSNTITLEQFLAEKPK